MPKTTIEANEIVKLKLNFVSLVNRGANQIPIRIMKKEDEPMIDVHARFRAMFKKAEKTPEVIGIVVKSDTPDEYVSAALKAANIEPETVTKSETEDGITTFTKGDLPTDGLMIVQSPNDIGILVANIKKGFDYWLPEGAGFADKARADGFHPSLYTAVDVLADYLCEKLRQSESPAQAAELLGSAVDEFKQYIQGVASALPETAFYVDRYAAVAKSETTEYSSPQPAVAEGETLQPDASVEKADETQEDADKEDEKKKKLDEEEQVEKDDEPETASNDTETPSLLKELAKNIENLTTAVLAIATKLDANLENVQKTVEVNAASVESKLQDFDARLQKTNEAVHGIVFTSPRDDRVAVEKTGNPHLSLLDTAYSNTA